jgi:hypothetical protein
MTTTFDATTAPLAHHCPDCGAAAGIRCRENTANSNRATEQYQRPVRYRHAKPHPGRVAAAWRAHLERTGVKRG